MSRRALGNKHDTAQDNQQHNKIPEELLRRDHEGVTFQLCFTQCNRRPLFEPGVSTGVGEADPGISQIKAQAAKAQHRGAHGGWGDLIEVVAAEKHVEHEHHKHQGHG